MKKHIFILGLTLLILIGCTNDDSTTNNGEEISTGASENQEPALEGFTFSEGRTYSDDRDTGVDVLSLEEAADIIAYYIYEVLGENLDGAHIEVTYNYNFNIGRRTWHGRVRHPLYTGDVFSVLINAETGERINLSYLQLEDLHGIGWEMMESMSEAELLEIFPEPDEAEIAEMMEVVREIAERHLQTSEVATIEYGFRQEDGSPNTTWDGPYQISPFTVIDTEGRVIEIYIQRETHLLQEINVPFG